jgi:hypothetical protein
MLDHGITHEAAPHALDPCLLGPPKPRSAAARKPHAFLCTRGSRLGAPGRPDAAILATTQPGITFRADAATYYLRVRAAAGAMVSEPSNEVSVSVAPAARAAAPLDPVLLPVSTAGGEATTLRLPDHRSGFWTCRSGLG